LRIGNLEEIPHRAKKGKYPLLKAFPSRQKSTNIVNEYFKPMQQDVA
jgi:hypothetical protein